jgi:hypothetical protein
MGFNSPESLPFVFLSFKTFEIIVTDALSTKPDYFLLVFGISNMRPLYVTEKSMKVTKSVSIENEVKNFMLHQITFH